MYRIMIARNGRYYGQKKTSRYGVSYWTRCTDFFFSRAACRGALRRLKCGCNTGCGCHPGGVVEYV